MLSFACGQATSQWQTRREFGDQQSRSTKHHFFSNNLLFQSKATEVFITGNTRTLLLHYKYFVFNSIFILIYTQGWGTTINSVFGVAQVITPTLSSPEAQLPSCDITWQHLPSCTLLRFSFSCLYFVSEKEVTQLLDEMNLFPGYHSCCLQWFSRGLWYSSAWACIPNKFSQLGFLLSLLFWFPNFPTGCAHTAPALGECRLFQLSFPAAPTSLFVVCGFSLG